MFASQTGPQQDWVRLAALGGAKVIGFNQLTSPLIIETNDAAGITFGNLNYNAQSLIGGVYTAPGDPGAVTLSIGSQPDFLWSGLTLSIPDSQAAGDIWVFNTNWDSQNTYVHELEHALSISSPVVLDLGGDGVELIAMRPSRARFDLDGDGPTDRTSWVGKGDAFLFLDRDGNGTISNAGEMSFVGDKENALSDLDGLTAFDSNRDGKLSSSDERFSEFKLWQDRNGDGKVGRGEILSLTETGVKELELSGTPIEQGWQWGDAALVNQGSFTWLDGSTGTLGDVALTYQAEGREIIGPGAVRDAGPRMGELLQRARAFVEASAAFGGIGAPDLLRERLGDFREDMFGWSSRETAHRGTDGS